MRINTKTAQTRIFGLISKIFVVYETIFQCELKNHTKINTKFFQMVHGTTVEQGGLSDPCAK